MDAWTIVLAAGASVRFGARKPYALLGGERLVDRVVRTAWSVSTGVAVVVAQPWDGDDRCVAVRGGRVRAASVRAGVAAVDATAEIVVVADAAHPLAPPSAFRGVVDAVAAGAPAATLAVPSAEAAARVDASGMRLAGRVGRAGLVLLQTPQAFRADVLRAVHASAPDAVEDTELVQAHGWDVAVVAGDARNVHVTTPAELAVAERLLPLVDGDA